MVLRLAGRDLDGVRAALGAADPAGRRATPVMISRTTLAVEPDGFRRIALLPTRGADRRTVASDRSPRTRSRWTLTGSRISLDRADG